MESRINLACGDVYINDGAWINLDYSPVHSAVRRADLLGRLPLLTDGAELVYSSHFIEHIPRALVCQFLDECYRVLAPGGLLRLVLPDLENLSRTYLEHRERGEHSKADFVVLEMIDQCVRQVSGGELGGLYRQLKSDSENQQDLISFVLERSGENLRQPPGGARNCQKLCFRGESKRQVFPRFR